MNKWLIFFVVCSIGGLIVLIVPKWQADRKNSTTYTIRLGDTSILAEVANTEEKRIQGLSGRNALGNNQGMLFEFPNRGYHSMWMKQMKFPLDIVWILDDTVVGTSENVPNPRTDSDKLPVYTPPEAVNVVLEVNAGFSKQHHVSKGTKITINTRL